MVLKNILLTIFLMTNFISNAQVNFNEYKYIVVPKQFEGFKNKNEYQTSTLIKHLFSQKNFQTVYDDNLPKDLQRDRCLGAYVYLIDNSSMFITKTALQLLDCNNQELFLSQEGKSKKKEYKAAFGEAIIKAFDSFASIAYSYKPKQVENQEEPITISFKNDVKSLEEQPKLEVNKSPMVEKVATKEVQYYKDSSLVESNYKKSETVSEKKIVEQKATQEEQSFKSKEPVKTNYNKEQPVSVKEPLKTLYAQELPNGYQLVDSTPKIQLKIFKSSIPNVYIAKADRHDGLVYTSDGKWFFEYHEGSQVVKEELSINF